MSLFAGVAARDITPPPPVHLSGYPRALRLATGVHDPLLASALYLASGPSAVLLGALDLLMLNGDVARQMRRRVARALRLGEERVLISCTHTHSGPVTLRDLPGCADPRLPEPDRTYLARVEAALVDAARHAKDQARPAELAWTTAATPDLGPGRTATTAPADPEMAVLAVRASDHYLALAVICGLQPAVLREESTLISSDFPDSMRQRLREALGTDLIVLHHSGPASGPDPSPGVPAHTFAEAERLGRQLGTAVLTSLNQLHFDSKVILGGVLQALDLPKRPLPSIAEAEQHAIAQRRRLDRACAHDLSPIERRQAERAVSSAERILGLARSQQAGQIDRWLAAVLPFEIQALRLGSACVVGFPGDASAAQGLELKRRAHTRSFPLACVNGGLQGGFVDPAATDAGGGDEAAGSLFAPEAGACLVERALSALISLVPPPPSFAQEPPNPSDSGMKRDR